MNDFARALAALADAVRRAAAARQSDYALVNGPTAPIHADSGGG